MPLVLPVLQSGLESVAASPPATSSQCAQAWADAVSAYAAGILPASTTVSAAAAALAASLASAFATNDASAAMESAFSAFAAAVGGGMVGYAPIPPVAPAGFASQFAGEKPATHQAAGQQIGSLINDWLTTGSSTLIASPFTVVPWS